MASKRHALKPFSYWKNIILLHSADVKKTFDLRIWIAVSQKFEFIDILKRILEQIRPINSSEQHKQTEYFLMELYKSFSGRKYLLVLDDVWTDELWTHIEQALVDANNGSRVLITSRNKNVAKVANPSHEPYKLPFLSEDVGLRLLLNKAICNQTYADDLTDVAKQLVKKCCGVPLALVVLGGLLSRRPAEYIEWNKLLQTMSWQTDGIQCTKILASSFDDLPLTLKYCFMYFAAFPKYYPIEAASLTRMWIAEGFIPQEQNRILEDTAERVLEELVQRYNFLIIKSFLHISHNMILPIFYLLQIYKMTSHYFVKRNFLHPDSILDRILVLRK
jgi:NB-ARC domain